MVNFPVLHSGPRLANVSGELFKFLDEGLVTTDFSFSGGFCGFSKDSHPGIACATLPTYGMLFILKATPPSVPALGGAPRTHLPLG